MNGEMLSELRRIAESENPVPQKQANRLMLAAMVSLISDIQSLRTALMNGQETAKEERQAIRRELMAEIETVKSNPAILLGIWVKKNPKIALLTFLLLFAIINIWFVSDFRGPVLEALGLPNPLVVLIP